MRGPTVFGWPESAWASLPSGESLTRPDRQRNTSWCCGSMRLEMRYSWSRGGRRSRAGQTGVSGEMAGRTPCRADRVNAKANRPGRNHLVSSYTTDGRSSLEWAGEEVMGWQALDTVGHWEVRTRAQRRKGRGRTWTKQSWKWRRRRRAGRAGLAATCAQVTLRTMESTLGQLFW